ncbi:MAG TPA: hypothetical protein VGD58_02820 [Herpetosiphonaceae bacterium]
MSAQHNLASLFETGPRQWGLRGDPHLWREMQSRLAECDYPATEAALMSLLEQIYHELVGVPVTSPEPIFVERFSHGGMSSGYVSPKFWIETGFPLLCSRYRDAA